MLRVRVRHARRWLAATLLALAALASAQEAPPPVAVYELSQNGIALGEAGVTLFEAEDGSFRSESYVDLPGLLTFHDVLETDVNGAATSYLLEGTVQGVAVTMSVAFDEAGGHAELSQAGQDVAFPLPSSEPLYMFDNNLIDGLQVLAKVALRRPSEPLDVAVAVPQVGALGRVTVNVTSETSEVEAVDASAGATRLSVVTQVGPQRLEFDVWVDENGGLVVVENAAAGIRYARRYGPPEETGQGAATVFLTSTAGCVELHEMSVASAGATLAGVLSLPLERPARGAPTLILLPGSGAVDLAGNNPPVLRNSGYQQLANALGCHGYGVLRIAKLGIPPSTGDGNAVTLDTYAENTRDWLAALASTAGVDAARLGIIGHSEGGLVALYAIAQGHVEPDALVLIASPGRLLDELLREQLIASLGRAGVGGEELEVAKAEIEELMEAVRASSGTALDLSGDLAGNRFAPLFAHAAGLLRSEFAADPLALAAGVDVPSVVVQGLKDVQVRQVDGANLAAALPNALLLELPDLTHNLVDTRGPAEELLVPGPEDAISGTVVSALATFLNGSLKLAD